MKAVIDAVGSDGTKMRRRTASWPECFRLDSVNASVNRSAIDGVRDYSGFRIQVYFVVTPGVYEVREPTREDWVSRYVLVTDSGHCSGIKASEVAMCLSEN